MNEDLEAMDGLCAKIIEQRDRIEALEVALQKIVSLIDSEADARSFYSWRHSRSVRAALDKDASK